MKTTLLTALVLLAATPAWACGGVACQGIVSTYGVVGKEWVEIINDNVNADPCEITNKSLIKRFLKVCPVGSECILYLGDRERGYRHVHPHGGPRIIITKWPEEGVEKLADPKDKL
jgi:hypothetical protein